MKILKSFFTFDKFYPFFVCCIFVVVITISLWRLPYSPSTWFDEGINIGIAKSLANHGVYSLQIGPGQFVSERPFLITTNYPILFPVAIFLKLFGANLAVVRLPSVFFLWLFCFLLYKLSIRVFSDNRFALLSVALVATFVPFYGNGKVVLGEVPGLTYFLAALLCLDKNFHAKKIFFAGILFGLAIATKPFFLIILPALFFGEFYNHQEFNVQFWQREAVLFLGLSIPLVIWVITVISPFSFGAIAETVRYYSNSYAASNFGDLMVANLFRFVTETTPIHFFLLFITASVGYIIRARKKQITEAEIIIGTFIVLNILWYLKTPGWYRYFFTAHILLFLFLPPVLFLIFKRRLALILIFAFLAVQSIYLFNQRNNQLYNSSEAVQFSTNVALNLKDDTPVLVINSPSIAFLLDDKRVYQYLQINPSLHFGNNSLKYDGQNYFPYIIISGSQNGTAIDGLEGVIATSYHAIITVGHFSLYKINYGGY